MSDTLRVRLSVVTAGGELLIRATALNQKKQSFFQAATETQAIAGLKSKLQEIQARRLVRAGYPKTIEVEL